MKAPTGSGRRLGWRSVRTQLIVWNIVTLAVMLGVLGGFIQYTVRATMLASVDRELDRMARPLLRPPGLRDGRGGPPDGGRMDGRGGPDLGPPPEDRPPDARLRRGGGPMLGPGLGGGPAGRSSRYRARVIDLTGAAIFPPEAHEPWDKAAASTARGGRRVYSTIQAEDGRIRVLSVPIPPSGRVDRVVQIPTPLDDVDNAMEGVNRALLTLIPVALLWAGLGGALLTGRALAPVRRLTQTAGRISAQDLSERLPVTGTDEFAELSSTFNAMLSRLDESFSEQRRFTADASHELRTPLTIIKANTSLALSGNPSPDDYHQAMDEINRAADTAASLVQNLLVLAHSDAGQLGKEKTALPIREILLGAIASTPRGDGPQVNLDAPDVSLCVLGCQDELVRVFANLIENAIRYTPADGTITASAQAERDIVRVTVSDTGSGIPAEHLPHLGERFYRVDPSRTRPSGGSGLGLSICKGIVEAHGGSIAFESAVGQGTKVTVTLPKA
ncbi:MAG TPA: ATP-binding protein [Armatimonadota bacterium]|jgi:signal transduction histidine kinase